ncbi:MAG: EamA family transporter [Microcoleaceae cyanobacterium]
MGIQDNQPLSATNRSPEEILSSVVQELETFQRDVKQQLSQDIERLQQDKHRLLQEVDQLRQEQEDLRFQRLQSLSERQVAQQQVWLKQLAQVLASNLQKEMVLRLNQHRAASDPTLLQGEAEGILPPPSGTNPGLPSQDLEAVLDNSLNQTFRELQQELGSYQSDLSQRLTHLQSLEEQMEALLETAVSRLQQQLGVTADSAPEQMSGMTQSSLPARSSAPVRSQPITSPVSKTQQPAAQPSKRPASQIQLGIFLALMSAITLSVFNVCLKILLKSPAGPRSIFGLFQVDGVISPGIGNSLLILLLRMIVVLLLMPVLATFLYPPVWSDLKRFLQSRDLSLAASVIGSGFFLFLSQVSIYVALGEINAGIAITIFFIYPIVTVFASWGLFGDRPTGPRIGAMILIVLGVAVLCLGNFIGSDSQVVINYPLVGIAASLSAGITFAMYVLLTQISAGRLHPVPFSLVNFFCIFVFSSLSLIGIGLSGDSLSFLPGIQLSIEPNSTQGLIIGSLILGGLTLCGYLLNNFAIRFAGAAEAAIIGAAGPALTALFAFFIIGESLSLQQIFGMILVILGVIAISLERMWTSKQKKASA